MPTLTTSDTVPRVGFLPRSAIPELLDVEADRFHEIDDEHATRIA